MGRYTMNLQFAWVIHDTWHGGNEVMVMDDFGELQHMGWYGFALYCGQDH